MVALLFNFYLPSLGLADLPESQAQATTKQEGVLILESNQLKAKGKADYLIDPSGLLNVTGKASAMLLGTYRFHEQYAVEPENPLSSQYGN